MNNTYYRDTNVYIFNNLIRSSIDCACHSSAKGLNTWVFQPDLDSCLLGNLTHVVLTGGQGAGITAGFSVTLPIASRLIKITL